MIPITIICWENEIDLRTISWNERKLYSLKEEYNLREGEAVVFRNIAQDKSRLVVNWGGVPTLLLTPVNPEEKYSLDLKIIHLLRKFKTASVEVSNQIAMHEQTTQERILAREEALMRIKKSRKRRAA